MPKIFDIKLDLNNVNEFLRTAQKYQNDINLCQGNSVVSAKSLMGILHLDLGKPIKFIFYDEKTENEADEFDKYKV